MKYYTQTPEYIVWANIKARCYRENHPAYKNYGGRGIGMAEEWRNDFNKFLEDVGNRPSPTHSIDRINVNGNYEPGNTK